ncbi:MAG: DUF2203 domain-containing protein [Candidatus Eremiobacteraeota bacterium]|nr:DUF2203 domain-containing protein [Candidatus Eremiobacteraeota bacterium]
MKLFSPEKANALIPKVAPLVEELWTKRRELAIKLLENDPALRPSPSRENRLAGRRSPFVPARFAELKAEIIRLVNKIEAYGCIVKDMDLGLLDFPAMRQGEQIYLCWKAGESAIAHWHGVTENFTERKPLEAEEGRGP